MPNGRKIDQMAGKLTKWPYNVPPSSIARTSKIYPIFPQIYQKFWIENKSSGNPVLSSNEIP
jgi:hypothetical protein